MFPITLFTVLTLSACWGSQAEGSRILGVFPIPSYSHHSLGNRLMKALAEKGHDVTIITPFREKSPPKNFREIYLEGATKMLEEMNIMEMVDMPPISLIFMLNEVGVHFTELALANPSVHEFLSDPTEKFDLVIVEQFAIDAIKGFAYHFKAPLAALSSTGTGPWVNNVLGSPAPRSYIPDAVLSYTPQMNFWQRLNNGFFGVLEELNYHFLMNPKTNALLQKYFPGSPSIEELNKNISILLVNSHVSANQAVPRVPNMIEVGSFHVYPPKKLPKDLQQYLDDAKEGVVYFSMGSALKSKDLPEDKKMSILKGLSRVSAKVLWKFEDDTLPGVPENVKLVKWAPQQDVLAHPNVKLFITHGGLLSTLETVYHGVPILGIPMFAEQKMNVANSVHLGIGKSLNFKDLTEETLLDAINQVLYNPRYQENAKRQSAIMRDQPVPPLENAVFWMEYVIRHGGAPHFKSAALDLAWYQYHMVDVIAFVFAVIALSFAVVYWIARKIFRRKGAKVDQKKKRK